MAYLYCILGILDLMLSSILGSLAGKLEGLDIDDDSLERKHVDRKLVAFIHVVQTPRRLGLPSINMSCDRSLHSALLYMYMYIMMCRYFLYKATFACPLR